MSKAKNEVDSIHKVVFLSHSSRDKHLVETFRDSFLPKKIFKEPRWTTLFTSDTDPQSHGVLQPGSLIWREIRERIYDTAYFIACVSEDYFKSPWCFAELALYLERVEKDKSLGFAILVLDPDFCGWTSNPLTQDRLVTFVTDSKALACLKGALSEKVGKNYDVNAKDFVRKIRPLLLTRKKQDKAHLLELAQAHYHHPRTSNGPIGGLVSRSEYVELATQMANATRWKLLWTLYKSPLMVADAYLPHRDKKYLMDYDRSWAGIDRIQKIRLVIFDDKGEVDRYIRCDRNALKHLKDAYATTEKHNWVIKLKVRDLKKRREDFNVNAKKNGGTLYFTAKKLLAHYCPQSDTTEAIELKPGELAPNSFLEFAYGDCGIDAGDCLIMESGFNSEFAKATSNTANKASRVPCDSAASHKAAQHFGHVVFYKDPGADCLDSIRKNSAYRRAFGHLNNLRIIAAAVFADPADPRVFFQYDKLPELVKNL